MARRAHAYPQITLTAADLIDGEILSAPSGVTAADALRLARRRRVRVLACGARQHVLADDLARAIDLGLGELPARDLARPLPIVTARTPDGEVMGVRHRARAVHGVQFHPESVLTPQGRTLIENFLQMGAAG